jgi:hypothetical protein
MSSFSHRTTCTCSLSERQRKLAYGESPEDALEILSIRLTPEEMAEILRDDYIKINQRQLQKYVTELG